MGHQTICEPGLSGEAAYEQKLEIWQSEIIIRLQGIDGSIDKAIKGRIFPTTYKPSKQLPNEEDWLAPMWTKILETASTKASTYCHQAMLASNKLNPP